MKKIGLIGGMSWESTKDYYENINKMFYEKLGGLNSAQIYLSSLNFAPIEKLQRNKRFDLVTEKFQEEIRRLSSCGAEIFAICSNTGNEAVELLKEKSQVNIVHIADSLGEFLVQNNIDEICLYGTIYTMEKDYMKSRLINKYQIKVIIPEYSDMVEINRIIYQELCQGKILENSVESFFKIIERNQSGGIVHHVLACTELQMLFKNGYRNYKIHDTTFLHCKNIVNLSLNEYEHKNNFNLGWR